MAFVLDSSALLAVINQENGQDVVRPVLTSSWISSVNLSEVLAKFAENNLPTAEALDEVTQLGLTIVEFDAEQARRTAELRPLTKHLGLSLGDRACLALARSLSATAMTADKVWASLKICKVKLIR